jgi:hypothetical protein
MSKLPPKGPRIDMRALSIAPPPVRERKPLGERNGLATYSRLGPNPERLARRRGKTDGPHVEWVRALPCCACMPVHYEAPIKPFILDRNPEDPEQARISHPHHTRTRGAGGLLLVAPLCGFHHDEIDSPGWGHDTFCAAYRIDLDAIADLLWTVSPFAHLHGESQP